MPAKRLGTGLALWRARLTLLEAPVKQISFALVVVGSTVGLGACSDATESPAALTGAGLDAGGVSDEPADPNGSADTGAPSTNPPEGPDTNTPLDTPDAGTTTPLGPCLPTLVGSGQAPLIDDFEADDFYVAAVDGRFGYEGTYSDTPESIQLSPVAGGAPGSTRAIRVSGTSAITYGTGWVFPMNGREDPACPYDASNYVGMGFWARSAQPSATISVVATVGALACRDVNPIIDCVQFYNTPVTIDSSWRRYELLWSDIAFVGQAPQPALGDPATIRNLYDLQFKPDSLGAFDFSIDDVEFLVGGCGSGVCNPARPCPSDCCGNQTCEAFEAVGGPPAGLAPGASYPAGLTYCASDCPLDRDGCPAGDVGSLVPQSVLGSTTLGLDDFAGSCDTSSTAPPLGAPDSEYVFTAPEAGQYVFDVTATNYQPLVYVLDGSCSGAELACSANASGVPGVAQSAVSVELARDQAVTVVVEGMFGARGPFTLDISQLGGVCPDEDLGSELPVSVDGTTLGAENSVVPSCGDVSSPDHTYLWTAPATGLYNFDLAGSSYDTVLQLRDGSCAGPELACNDNNGFAGLQSRVSASLSEGQTVAVSIDGRGASGAYTLVISELVCPAGNLGNSVPVTQTGSTAGLPDLVSAPCGATGSPDTALTWTAPAAGTYVFDTVGSIFDTVLYVLDGATCGGAVLGCNDDSVVGGSQVTVTLAADQQVVVVVDGFAGGSGPYTLNIGAL